MILAMSTIKQSEANIMCYFIFFHYYNLIGIVSQPVLSALERIYIYVFLDATVVHATKTSLNKNIKYENADVLK